MESITFSTTSTVTTTRSLSIVVDDSRLTDGQQYGSGERQRGVFRAGRDAVGPAASYTAGGSPVAVDSGVTVSSYDTDLTGATVTISAGTLQSGDTLNFTNQKRHQRQLRRRRADLDRQRYAGPIPSGLAVGHVLVDQHQHHDSGDFHRCR